MKTQNSFTKFVDLCYLYLTKLVFSLNFLLGRASFDVHSFSFLFKSTFTKTLLQSFFLLGLGLEKRLHLYMTEKVIMCLGSRWCIMSFWIMAIIKVLTFYFNRVGSIHENLSISNYFKGNYFGVSILLHNLVLLLEQKE
jgi:hypothetical protein